MGNGPSKSPGGQVPQELLDQLHMTRQEFEQAMSQFNAVQGTTGYNAFAIGDSAETGTLWLGMQEKPGWKFPGLPPTRPEKSHKQVFTIFGHKVEFITPDYGEGYTYEWHSSYGDGYLHENQLAEARAKSERGEGLNGGVRIFLVVKDKDGKQVDVQNLDATQTDQILGVGGGTRGHPTIGPSMDQPIRVSSDPYKERAVAEQNGGTTIVGGPPQQEMTGTIQSEMEKLYDLNPKQMRKLKTQLWLAGYYPSGMALEDVNMNVITNEDISAFGGVMVAASRYYQAGEKKTWQELLTEQATDPAAKNRKDKEEPIIPLSDPVAIAQAANEMGTKILGRAPSSSDVAAIVAMIHGRELEYGKKQNAGGGEGVVQPDPNANMEQYMRQHYPNEAMAVDWGSAAQQWDDLLMSSSPQPPIVGAPRA